MSQSSTHRLEHEALQLLRVSSNVKDIRDVCSYFPYRQPEIALQILSNRRTENTLTDDHIDEFELRIAEEILRNSYASNWQWRLPSSTGPTGAADIDKDLLASVCKANFMALIRNACGFQSIMVEDMLKFIDYVRLQLDRHSPVHSNAIVSIINPIKELFEKQELALKSLLQRAAVLYILWEEIVHGLDPNCGGLSAEDFSFLEDLNNNDPSELTELLTNRPSLEKLCPDDLLDPPELRGKSPEWSKLIHLVMVCIKADCQFVDCLYETAKISLNQGSFSVATALIYGLAAAHHPPSDWYWTLFTVRHVYNMTGAETENGRSCMGMLSNMISTCLSGIQQNMAGSPHTEHSGEVCRKEAESISGNEPRYVDRSETEASNLVLSGSGAPNQHVISPSDMVPVPVAATDDIDLGMDLDSNLDSNLESDSDSAIGGVHRRDSTTTLPSEFWDSDEKFGREYHGYWQGKYLLPNDDLEHEILDFQHELCCRTFNGKLYLASLPTPMNRALDMCTGTGKWALDFAEKHPETEVYGVDLSHKMPNWTTTNCKFQVDDLSEKWTFNDKFDYVHGRMMFCLPNPPHFFKEAFKALSSAGVIEIHDLIFNLQCHDNSLEGSALEDWVTKLKEAFRSKGIDLACASKYRNYLEIAGFENIEEEEFCWPICTWSQEEHLRMLGHWCRENILQMLFAISIVPFTEDGMSVEEVELLLVGVREDLRNPDIHAYLQVVVIHGQKPSYELEG